MKTKLLWIVSLIAVLVLSLMLASCGDDTKAPENTADLTGISTQGFLAEDGVYKTVVQNATTNFNTEEGILAKIGMRQGADYKLFSNKECTVALNNKVISLNPGDNFVYLKVSDVSGHQRQYTFNVYRKQIYTVTYDPNGGAMESTTSTVEEGTILFAPQAIKPGYVLKWDYDFTKPITSNTTIKAEWIASDCVIVTDVDGVLTEYVAKFGEVPNMIPKPSKVGYSFVGWMYGNSSFDVTKPVNFDGDRITIVAIFEPSEYNVQYILYGATNNPGNPNKITAQDGKFTLLAPEKANYKFGGWYTEQSFSSASLVTEISIDAGADIVLFAKWNYISSVTFDANGGDCETKSSNFVSGEAYSLPKPTKSGFIFVGWFDGETKVEDKGVWSIEKNVTLVAKWSAEKTEINYELNLDGAVNNNPTILDTITENIELTAPAFEGKFIFDGWYSDSKFTSESKITHITTDMVGKKITLYAKWNPIYTVTLNADGGTGAVESLEFILGESYKLPEPLKDGFKFAGWYNGNARVDSEGIWDITSNVTLLAKWTEIPVEKNKITYVLGYEGVVNENPVDYDGKEIIDLIPATFDENHTFLGWYTSSDFNENSKIEKLTPEMFGEDITIYAKWSTSYTVTLDIDGDKTTVKVTYNDDYSFAEPTKQGYRFTGWFNGNEHVSSSGKWTIGSDVTLVAGWELVTFKIEYVLGYENLANDNPTSFDITTGTVTLKPVEYDEKHEFAGWYRDSAYTEAITEITPDMYGADIKFYAKWNVKSTVNFDLNGGDGSIDPIDIIVGSSYTLPIPTRENYEFCGWTDSEGKLVDTVGDAWKYGVEGVTVLANWEAKEYSINYVLNGGEKGGDYPTKYTVLSADDLLSGLTSPTKQHATFLGWFVDADCTVSLVGYDFKSVKGITLYAKWDEKKIEFELDANGGAVADAKVSFNFGVAYVLPTPVRTGYNFIGWYDGDQKYEMNGTWTDENVLSVKLIAKWSEPIVYNITYDLAGGSINADLVKEYTVLSEIKLPTPTKANSYFVGWSINDGAPNPSVLIKSGTGDLTIKACWTNLKDNATGLLFSVVGDKQLSVVGIDRVIDSSIKSGIVIPATFDGCTVVAIESNAFKAFGEEFTLTSYANMSNSFVTISIPTTVKRVGANAFKTCNGIKICLNENGVNLPSIDYKTWDKLVEWEEGNKAARDCIWGFRPAIGWTRYSKVEIPEGYDYLES